MSNSVTQLTHYYQDVCSYVYSNPGIERNLSRLQLEKLLCIEHDQIENIRYGRSFFPSTVTALIIVGTFKYEFYGGGGGIKYSIYLTF